MSIPNYPALVLNADYTPLSVVPLSTWPFDRTLRNVMKGRVNIVAEYEAVLRSPSFEYTPPSVIALKDYVKKPRNISFSRMNIFLRDNFCCQYCGKKFRSDELTFDHVVPRAKGGKTSYTNIVSACIPCNTRKGSKQEMKPINDPFIPTVSQLADANLVSKNLHKSWLDYLYWSGILEQS